MNQMRVGYEVLPSSCMAEMFVGKLEGNAGKEGNNGVNCDEGSDDDSQEASNTGTRRIMSAPRRRPTPDSGNTTHSTDACK